MNEPRQPVARRKSSRIPTFATRDEEAAWWEKHDLADYQDEFKPVRVRVAKNLSEGLTIRLQPQNLAELRERAEQTGVGPTTLARMWILERLREKGGASA